MALYGWQQPKPPNPNAGFKLYGPQAPGTTGPRYRPPKSTFRKPRPKAPKRPGKVFDPLAPLTDAQIRSKVSALLAPQNAAQIAAIQQAIEARSRAGQAAIGGYTQQLGNLFAMAAPATAAAYQQANQAVSGVNQQVADRLNSFGQNLGGELQGKLALQNAPTNVVGQVAGGAASTAQGVSNANFAKGAAEVSRLAAEGAHAGEYAAKMPGIAGLMGLQETKNLQAQLSKQLSDQLAAQSSKAQDTFASLYQSYVSEEFQKTLARQSGQFKSAQAAADAKYKAQLLAYKRATLAWNKAKAKADLLEKKREADRRIAISQQNANTSAGRAAETKRHNRASETQRSKTQKEIHRHNIQTEKNSSRNGRGGKKKPWQTG